MTLHLNEWAEGLWTVFQLALLAEWLLLTPERPGFESSY